MRPRLIISVAFLVIIVAVLFLSLRRPSSVSEEITWGFTFSPRFAEYLEIPWREAYIASLDELEPRLLRIPIYWNDVEKEEGMREFDDYDFMINEANARQIPTTIAIGRRVPRWPECHVPEWAKTLSEEKQVEKIMPIIEAIVTRYRDVPSVSRWQVENEPFLAFFGECPPPNAKALDREIALVRSLDASRPILTTDSGELSLWLFAAKRGDVFGTTMYRTVWSKFLSPYVGYITYPLPPKFFWLKANLVHLFFGDEKKIINIELQAEPWTPWGPWGPGFVKIMSLDEQDETMSPAHFYENIEYARDVGFSEVYLWGVEWWYLMKEKYDRPFFWEAAKEVIKTSPVISTDMI